MDGRGILHSNRINLGDFVLAVSQALDLASPQIFDHAIRVAYIAFRISNLLEVEDEQQKDLLLAALLHDAGISSTEMKMDALEFDLGENAQQHCIEGYNLFKNFYRFSQLSPLILYHHNLWEKVDKEENTRSNKVHENEENQYNSYNCSHEFLGNLLHLADRVEISIKRNQFILEQVGKIQEKINSRRGTTFAPYLVDTFNELVDKEAFWLDLESGYSNKIITDQVCKYQLEVPLSEVRDLSLIFAEIVDRKSPFTGRHSRGIAETSTQLAESFGFSPHECQQMEIAALLHDLGKLSVPNSILEKPGPLEHQEMLIMKQHTFYTYHLLSRIEAFETIKEWAAFHHEKLNGKGYPFGLHASDISLGARIMAVSDVYQALTEERPYRKAMSQDKALSILEQMSRDFILDQKVVEKLKVITLPT